MRQIDMSRDAVTARLKFVSQLRRLCLALGTAKIRPKELINAPGTKPERVTKDPDQQRG
ncbi:MAG: hypothetical protein ABJB21_07010 [bacterium]